MRVLLADDEPVALARLELALAGVPSASLVARARNGREALRLIQELRPAIAVLDIDMPGLDGLRVAEMLKADDHIPEIIFVTAYQEHAIRAFELHAVDYLLKPIAFDRFRESLRRAESRQQARAADARLMELQNLLASLREQRNAGLDTPYEQELWAKTRDGLRRIPVDTIDYIAADGDYVMIHAGKSCYLLKDTIISLQNRLDPKRFLRIHRSTIVQATSVRSLQRRSLRGMAIILNDGTRLPVGPSFANGMPEAVRLRRWRTSDATV
jgi:DNA-binding LytR/AlgR family response regulator